MYKTSSKMGKQKKHKEKRPEEDKNNVAYYKKKNATLEKDEPSEMPSANRSRTFISPMLPVATLTPISKEEEVPEPKKTWSQVASSGTRTQSSDKMKRKIMKIKPEFESDTVGYDRIVITPTHFNNKPFKGFITDEEAKIIRMAIGLENLDNLHGTTFYRSEEDVLFITYKLKKTMSIQQIYESIHRFFWFDKTSKAGNQDKISGQVVHPPMEFQNQENEESISNQNCETTPQYRNIDNTKEIKIDGCNYELSKKEITSWIEMYGEIKSELEELAIPGDNDGTPVGTGSYTIKMKLNRLIPNVLPMQGLKIKCSYQGVKKQCGNCYGYHRQEENHTKRKYNCTKTTFQEYKETFKENNPGIKLRMMGLDDEEDSINEDYSSETNDFDRENNDGIPGRSDYFNYNYSYDFVPDWNKDAKDKETLN